MQRRAFAGYFRQFSRKFFFGVTETTSTSAVERGAP
jgi:hypothetical protein